MGLWLVGRRPVLSKGGYSNSPDLNAAFTFVCLALSMTRPRSLRTLLTYELLGNSLNQWQRRSNAAG